MNTRSYILRLVALCALASALTACGQRGPLHMPDEKPAKKSGGTTIHNAPIKLKTPEDEKAKPGTPEQPKPE